MLKKQQAYQRLRTQILEGQRPAGARLNVSSLSNELQMSQIPVREALGMLERDGLVENIAYSGSRVRMISPKEAEEALLVRGYLESLAARLAASVISHQELHDLASTLDAMDEAEREHDPIRYAELNGVFHEAIALAGPNRFLATLIHDIWSHQVLFGRVFALTSGHMAQSQEDHREILSALKAGDGPLAAALVENHKRRAALALTEILNHDQQAATADGRGRPA